MSGLLGLQVAKDDVPGAGGVPILDVHDGAAHVEQVLAALVQDRPDFLYVDHEGLSAKDHNLLMAARRHPEAREVLDLLSLSEYYTWSVRGQRTTFVHHDALVRHWTPLLDGSYEWADYGIAYTYSPASAPVKSLLVVLSGGPPNLFSSSVDKRYFTKSFPNVQSILPAHAAVLRISDLGGPGGTFYLDTTPRPDSFAAVDDLIRAVATSHGISEERIVLTGPSKGATGALAHGLANDWAFVSVDPIVEDEYYEQEHDDLSMTATGFFIHRKRDLFETLIAQTTNPRGAIITSDRSPHYTAILDAFSSATDRLALFNSHDPAISSHPSVALGSINLRTMLFNLMANGLTPPPGLHHVM